MLFGRVLSIDELYDVVHKIHLELNHARRNELYMCVSQEFHRITEKACNLFYKDVKTVI